METEIWSVPAHRWMTIGRRGLSADFLLIPFLLYIM
jgi:hypothetical protein